jgi:DNA-directed RNA polymerase subunit RPC12/RpoP
MTGMLNWELKSCARCGGDLFIDRDIDGWFVQCLQCSYRKELKELKNQLIPVRVKPSPIEDWSKRKEK